MASQTQMAARIAAMDARLNAMDARMQTMSEDYTESLDTIWMLVAGTLVFFMHAGFSLLEAGSVRFKNAQNILAKNLLVVACGFLCWWAVGWALAYGVAEEPNKFMGSTQFVADGFMDDKTLFRNFFFQGAFAATGGTIVSGAMAERTKLTGFAIYTLFMTSVIYPVVVYWGWSGSGFLNYTDEETGEGTSALGGPPYMDFAGSGLVHLVGGMGGLCGAIVVGARKDRFDDEAPQDEFAAHNVPFQCLGTLILWVGWFGFNPGSTLAMSSKDAAYTASIVAVNTTLAPCAAGLVVFIAKARFLPPRLLDVGAFCNGILAGLVSITAGCAAVKAWESIVIGFIGGFVYMGCSALLQRLKIDDVVDAFPVHGACGIWGTLALGFFGNPDEGLGGNGVLYGGNQLGTQILAVIVIMLWVGALSTLVFVPLRNLGLLRLGDDFQTEGADALEHTPTKAFSETPGAAPATAKKNSDTILIGTKTVNVVPACAF